jgi:dihydrofolate reductase
MCQWAMGTRFSRSEKRQTSIVASLSAEPLRLMIHPIVLDGGKRLFEDGGDREALKLVDCRRFATGVIYLTYQTLQS